MKDAVVVGAGAAGLMVARELKRGGYSVAVLEASERVGGRVRTLYETSAGIPLELGAEFIHGEAPTTQRILDEARLVTIPVLGEDVRYERGELSPQDRVWKRMARVFKRLDPNRDPDRSFQEFLEDKPGGPQLKEERELARGFVQGFHAADPERISEKAIAQQGNPIEGAARSARVVNGYGALIQHLYRELVDVVHFKQRVTRIIWDDDSVRVFTDAGRETASRVVVITVPLPFLQDESIAFEPEVPTMRKAARQLIMGHVVRINVVVRERFWEQKLAELSFVHTPDRAFNVWWTLFPLRAYLVVGWSGGPPALELAMSENLESRALADLARAFGLRRSRMERLIESLHTYDWTNDPHIRGAYSYVGVGGANAAQLLSRPVRGKLFFAGEATEQNSGTVEGALASAQRSFRQVIQSLG